jgi:hypothetical protein
MLRKFTKKRALVVASIAVVAVAAVAYAFWSSTGSGTGTAATADPGAQTVSVSQSGSVTGLYPGGPAQALSGSITNNNSNSVHVGSVTATVVDTSNEANCPGSEFVIAGTAPVNANVAGSGGTAPWSGLTVALTDTGVEQNDCKNVTVNLSYAAN